MTTHKTKQQLLLELLASEENQNPEKEENQE